MITIVGGGASGTLAAILLAKKGCAVRILEKNRRLMNKIYATGNGRCNFSNRYISIENYHGQNPNFVKESITDFNYEAHIQMMHEMGILSLELEDGRCYPASLQAKTIPRIFQQWVDELKIDVRLDTHVKSIQYHSDFYTIQTSQGVFETDILVLATGGKSMPQSGSTGEGYEFARCLKHTVVPTHPGIVALKTYEKIPKFMVGQKYPAAVTLLDDQIKMASYCSDILWTEYGLSGPAILQLSQSALRVKKPRIQIDNQIFFSEAQMMSLFKTQQRSRPDLKLNLFLRGLINNNLIEYVCFGVLSLRISLSEVKTEQMKVLISKIKRLSFEIIGSKDGDEGQVTCGGVCTDEIDEKTFESKLNKNLYLLGELMDIDGDCGGYNIHWAFASAYMFAKNFTYKG